MEKAISRVVNGKVPNSLYSDGVQTVQQLLGHIDVRTRMIYTHVTSMDFLSERSQPDQNKGTNYRVFVKGESGRYGGYPQNHTIQETKKAGTFDSRPSVFFAIIFVDN